MKKIYIKFVDFAKDFDPLNNDFLCILKKHFNVCFSDSPEYLFYSCFGNEHLKYDCIRIFYTGECIVPDFNICDYAIGFDEISFGDRYLRVPLYALFQYKKAYETGKRKHKTNMEISTKKFCNFVCSNCDSKSLREQLFIKLSEYKRVDSGGRYKNNVGGPVKDKLEFQKKYKFSIAFENCSYKGYTTEKIVQAFAAGTIPIYWGDPDIDKYFNPKSFINANNLSIDEIIEQVKKIDESDDLYKEMLFEPMQLPNQIIDYESAIENFFLSIFTCDLTKAVRRPIGNFAQSYEDEIKLSSQFVSPIYRMMKRIKYHLLKIKKSILG